MEETSRLGDLKRWLPVMILGGLLLGGSAFWFHTRAYNATSLVQMLPPDRSSYVYVDVGLLRTAGVLDKIAGSASIEDADYRKFVAEVGFDYRKDLDMLAVAFRDGDVFYAAQGRFDWKKLAAYAPGHGGSCDRFICTTPGTVPGRNVSYYMPRNGILAIAVSRKESAGDMVAPGSWASHPVIGTVGMWVMLPHDTLADLNKVPSPVRSFVQPLAQATQVIFTLGPGSKDFALEMQLTAKDAESAAKLTKQLTDLRDALNKALADAPKDDLVSVLAGGHFTAKDANVSGTWPISRAFLESLGSSIDIRK